jgi:hypothetical protein
MEASYTCQVFGERCYREQSLRHGVGLAEAAETRQRANPTTQRQRAMIGTPLIAGYVAQMLFWIVLAIGAVSGEVGRRGVVLFAILWGCGVFGLGRFAATGVLVTPFLAVLDIVLVLLVFKADVRAVVTLAVSGHFGGSDV